MALAKSLMNTTDAQRLHRVWQRLVAMRVYSYRQEAIDDLEWLIEDYKRLDDIVDESSVQRAS